MAELEKEDGEWSCFACDELPLDSMQKALEDFQGHNEELESRGTGSGEDSEDADRTQCIVDELVVLEGEIEDAQEALEAEAVEQFEADVREGYQQSGEHPHEEGLSAAVAQDLERYRFDWEDRLRMLLDRQTPLQDRAEAAGVNIMSLYREVRVSGHALTLTPVTR